MTVSEMTTDRFLEGYRTVQALKRTGRIISRMAMILALPIVIVGFEEAGHGRMGLVLFPCGLGATLGLIGYGIGKSIIAKACILRATIDQAVNTCALLTEDERVEVMSLQATSPWRQLGIKYCATQTQPTTRASSGARDVGFYSPVSSLFESQSIPSLLYSSPIVRSERHLARPGRRRAR